MGVVETCRSQVQRDRTVTAEVVFLNHSVAPIAVKQFDGAHADGQVIRAYITKTQSIPDINTHISHSQQSQHQSNGTSNIIQSNGQNINGRASSSSSNQSSHENWDGYVEIMNYFQFFFKYSNTNFSCFIIFYFS